MAKFIMLIGIPAVGKSYFANKLIEENDRLILLSSDEIRRDLFNSDGVDVQSKENNNKVFEIMNRRAINMLKDGFDVIYDATNINRKRRRHLLNQLPNNTFKRAVYLYDGYENIIYKNENRERVVPKSVIKRMYKNLHIPIYSEGWDDIIFHRSSERPRSVHISPNLLSEAVLRSNNHNIMSFLATYFSEFYNIFNMPQDSKYHNHSVSMHTYYVYKYILDNYKGSEEDREMMLWASLLHDIGKYHCKNFFNYKGERQEYANFIGHENVGAQITIDILNKLGYDENFIYNVATLVQFHMYLLNENSSTSKLIEQVGGDLFKKLQILRIADTQSH